VFFKCSIFVLQCSRGLCSSTDAVYSVYNTTKLSYLRPQFRLSFICRWDSTIHIIFTADTDISLKLLSHCLSDTADWMTNNRHRLNANKTDFVIISTSRQRSKPTCFFPTNILNHSITLSDLYLILVLYLIAILISENIFLWHVAAASSIFATFAVFVAILFCQSPKPLLQHSLLVGLINAILFFIILQI